MDASSRRFSAGSAVDATGVIRVDFKNSSPQKACLFKIDFSRSAGAATMGGLEFFGTAPPALCTFLAHSLMLLGVPGRSYFTAGAGLIVGPTEASISSARAFKSTRFRLCEPTTATCSSPGSVRGVLEQVGPQPFLFRLKPFDLEAHVGQAVRRVTVQEIIHRSCLQTSPPVVKFCLRTSPPVGHHFTVGGAQGVPRSFLNASHKIMWANS